MATINKIIYLANSRVPTEKAHGYQICKMCEAFAQNGVEVQLWHPFRHQFDSKLQKQSGFDYYGITPIFQVRTLPNWDVVRLNYLIPDNWFAPIFFAHGLLWGFYAARAAAAEKADIYFTRDSTTAYWLTKLGLPTVYEAHVVPKRAQRGILRRIARDPALQLVVVLTSFIKEEFMKIGFPGEKIAVVPDGVDLSLFAELPSREECRRRFELPPDRPIVGYIGRFRTMEMEKGVPTLIHAMKYLHSINEKEPLLLCVGGPMEAVPSYLDLARCYGLADTHLRFVDRVSNREVPLWMRACDVVTIPWGWTEFSAYYTSPLKLFEYMAAGVPMVASDLPSLREVLRDEENALLVTPDNPEQLCADIVRLTTDPALGARLARCASQDVRRYSWKGRARQILQISTN
jgi:glycosyltransferase involved in cell wall biosynthesis